MVLLIPLIAAIPTVIGVSEAVASQRNADASASGSAKDEKAQMRKFTLECYCAGGKGRRAREVHGGKVVLRGGKLWIQPLPKTNNTNTNTITNTHPPPPSSSSQPHPFLGFYLPYPDPARKPQVLGLVSFINTSPPTLNWVYVDQGTREVRYGNRTQSISHVVGEWGWDLGDEEGEGEGGGGGGGVTLSGEEGAVVRFREGGEGGWEVLWEGDGGAAEGGLRVSLERRWVDADEGGGGGGEGEGEEKEEKVKKLEVRTLNASSSSSSKGKKRGGAKGGG